MFRLTVLLGLALVASAQHFRNTNSQFSHSQRHFNPIPFPRDAPINQQQQLLRDDDDTPVVPREYVEAHQAWSLDLLKHQYYSQTVEKHGAVSVSPFSFAHFLAIVHERTYNVPTVNIPKILHLNADRVADSYSIWTDAHEDDHKSYLTAQLYTPNENTVLTPGLTRLDVHKQKLHFAEDAPSLINSHIRVATHDKIVDALVPDVPALNRDTT
jgi:hypothetical protein